MTEPITDTPDPVEADVPAGQMDDPGAANPASVEPADVGSEPDTFPAPTSRNCAPRTNRGGSKAQQADQYAQRLHTELVKATGRLADLTDMPYDETHLDKPEKLATAIEELLQRKPHLASRRPSGDVGQGAAPSRPNVDLAAILRNAK